MHCDSRCDLSVLICVVVAGALLAPVNVHGAAGGPGDIDMGFDPQANGVVMCISVQPDRKLIIGGQFTVVRGSDRLHLARLNEDGTIDDGFSPSFNGAVRCIAVQPDGKIIVGGTFGMVLPNGAAIPTMRNRITRLNPDGTLDDQFDPNVNGDIFSLSLQPDGKIIVGGSFGAVQPNGAATGVVRNRVARLNADGTLDELFDPNFDGDVFCTSLQANGVLIVAGAFSSVHPNGVGSATTRNRIARLNADGTLEGGFDPDFDGDVYCVAIQPDGKLIVGGGFNNVHPNATGSPAVRHRIARLEADGTLDNSFDPDVDEVVRSIVLQADGKMVIGGSFLHVGITGRERIARLLDDGELDENFSASVDDALQCLALQVDGKVLIGGGFLNIGGLARAGIGRLENSAASESLTVQDLANVEWVRSDASPEVVYVMFDLSTDGGGSWAAVGYGARTVSGWGLSGMSLPANGKLRARALTIGGSCNGSSGFVESIADFAFEPEIVVEQPIGTNITDGGTRSSGPVIINSYSDLTFTITNVGIAQLTISDVVIDGADSTDFNVVQFPATMVVGGANTVLTIRCSPTVAGSKTASLHILSNDSDEASFDITVAARVVSFADDLDGDGLNDASEVQMAALGFDWQTTQIALVNTYFASANGAGLFTPSQVQSMNAGVPLLSKNPADGLFTIVIGLEKSSDLVEYQPFPMSSPQTVINAEGKLEFKFTVPDSTAFFRLRAQ